MHVSRQPDPIKQIRKGLKLPVIYISSPYFAGVASNLQESLWNGKGHELEASTGTVYIPEVVRDWGKAGYVLNPISQTWVTRGLYSLLPFLFSREQGCPKGPQQRWG